MPLILELARLENFVFESKDKDAPLKVTDTGNDFYSLALTRTHTLTHSFIHSFTLSVSDTDMGIGVVLAHRFWTRPKVPAESSWFHAPQICLLYIGTPFYTHTHTHTHNVSSAHTHTHTHTHTHKMCHPDTHTHTHTHARTQRVARTHLSTHHNDRDTMMQKKCLRNRTRL